MTPEMRNRLKVILTKHEGRKNFPYVDTVGKSTIGIGYNLTDRGLPDSWIDKQFEEDCDYFYGELNKFLWFQVLNEARQIALVDMSFMGMKKFLEFKRMIAALTVKDYQIASMEMLKSTWASQVGNRAFELAKIIREGEI